MGFQSGFESLFCLVMSSYGSAVISTICGNVRVPSLAKWSKHGSWWTWFSCRRICFVSESISGAAYGLKGNGIQWQTKSEPEEAKFNYQLWTFSRSLI